jgi:hypothetical protein
LVLSVSGQRAATYGITLLGFNGIGGKYGNLLIPWDMVSIGAPRCFLEVVPVVNWSWQVASNGEALLANMAVPQDKNLARAKFFLQGGLVDPLANPLGLVMMPSLEVTVGTGEFPDASCLLRTNYNGPNDVGARFLDGAALIRLER